MSKRELGLVIDERVFDGKCSGNAVVLKFFLYFQLALGRLVRGSRSRDSPRLTAASGNLRRQTFRDLILVYNRRQLFLPSVAMFRILDKRSNAKLSDSTGSLSTVSPRQTTTG